MEVSEVSNCCTAIHVSNGSFFGEGNLVHSGFVDDDPRVDPLPNPTVDLTNEFPLRVRQGSPINTAPMAPKGAISVVASSYRFHPVIQLDVRESQLVARNCLS